ncbi:hypothetical protein Tco_1457519 [Tanacetum coccineum]
MASSPSSFDSVRRIRDAVSTHWLIYHDLYLGGKALVERENVGFYLTMSDLCPSFVKDLTTKGVGLYVADSHTVLPSPTIFISFLHILCDTLSSKKEELSDFFTTYPIPSEYKVMLPKSNQTLFDDPNRLNPFGYAKLTTFAWLTFAKIHEKHIRNLMPKVITRIEGWKGRFFFVQDSIVPAGCPKLLSKDNRYPTNVRVFPDPILFLAGLKTSWEYEMAIRNFMYVKTDEDLTFLPKDSSPKFGTGSPFASINTELPLVYVEPMYKENTEQIIENVADSGGSLMHQGKLVIHPGNVAKMIKDRKCRTRGGYLKPPIKRRLVQGASSSCATRQKIASLKDDSPFLTISDDDEGLPDRGHLDNQLDVELLDLHDRYYANEAAMTDFDNNLAIQVLHENIAALLVEVASLEAEKARLEIVNASLRQDVEDVRCEKVEIILKVVPYVVMELVHSDELGMLVGKLVSSIIFYGRCAAFEEVAEMKEPFNPTEVKGYRPSYKKEHTKARNNLAAATFPFLSMVVVDPSASVEALL